MSSKLEASTIHTIATAFETDEQMAYFNFDTRSNRPLQCLRERTGGFAGNSVEKVGVVSFVALNRQNRIP
jgi:TRAP-type mannitol/chloroaromatic compound transport system substrate-binding protein